MSHPAWQFLVKQRKAAEMHGQQFRVSSGPGRVERIDFQDADRFIREYEWLGNIGAAKYCFGLWIGNDLAAVACYTAPAAPLAYHRLLGKDIGSAVFLLCRGASTYWAPKWAASKIISGSLRHLHREFGARAVVAYADPKAGEIGTVYQAANALYLGLTDSRGPGSYRILGQLYHARAVPKHFGSAREKVLRRIDPNYRRFQRTKKHRYLFVLGTRSERSVLVARIQHLIQHYPKRSQAEASRIA